MTFDRDRVKLTIALETGIPMDQLQDGMAAGDLGDSLEVTQLIIALEDEYCIEIPDNEIALLYNKDKTLADVLETVKRHVEPTGSGTTNEAPKA